MAESLTPSEWDLLKPMVFETNTVTGALTVFRGREAVIKNRPCALNELSPAELMCHTATLCAEDVARGWRTGTR